MSVCRYINRLCRALAPRTWQYTGREGKYYVYRAVDYAKGFKKLRALPVDMTRANLAIMATNNWSR